MAMRRQHCFFCGWVPDESCLANFFLLDWIVMVALLFWPASVLVGQDVVAARVGDDPILISTLEPLVSKVTRRTPAEGLKLEIIQAQVLEENIKQRLVFAYLNQSSFRATAAEIGLEMTSLQKDLKAQGKTIDDLLKQQKITIDQLKRSLAWEISWGKYLDNYLTEDNLKKFFGKHHYRFDGSSRHIAHVLIKPRDESSSDSWKAAYELAADLYKQIESGKLTFEQAVINHSSGATKINNGDLGWIDWNGPMTPPFTVAAFQLKKGEISKPVQTTFGFHLIRMLEEKPGKKTLNDVRPRVLQAVKRYLFDWLAERQARETKIGFTGSYPYFEWGTKKLGQYRKKRDKQ